VLCDRTIGHSIQLLLTYLGLLTLLDLDHSTPAGALGDEIFPPTLITGHSANTTPADSHLL